MGCEVVLINRDPLGVFSHNPEPLPENLKEISERVVKERADIGFAQDPDCDRLALICENGAIPGEEAVVVLAVRNILEYHKKGNVVVNLSTTMLVEDVAKSLGALVYRAKIGEVNVVEKMKETGAVIGGEGNGGVIFPEAHYGRDSFVGMALILEYLALRDTSISVVINEMPKYFILKEKITVSDKHKAGEILNTLEKTLKEKEQMNTEDGIKIIRADGWIHIRPSGTEPVIRVYAEAKSKDIARQYLSEFISLISS